MTGDGGERQPGVLGANRCSRRRAPWQPAYRAGGCAARPRAPSPPSIAVGQHACGRPRCGYVAAVLPHAVARCRRLPYGRLTRPLPPPVKGHGRDTWCEDRSGKAVGRWEPRLPGQPALRLGPHALVRAALANSNADRRGLWGRAAGTHSQVDTSRPRVHPMRRSGKHSHTSHAKVLSASATRVDDKVHGLKTATP